MAKTIHHKLFFPQDASAVWEYLTDAELIGQWLMKNDFKPIIGHEFRLTTRPLPQLNFDGIFHCKVLELETNKKLAYSLKGGPGAGEITLDSVVTWTLRKVGEGTELELNHDGFNEATVALFSAMDEGWFKNMKKIAEQLKLHENDTNKP